MNSETKFWKAKTMDRKVLQRVIVSVWDLLNHKPGGQLLDTNQFLSHVKLQIFFSITLKPTFLKFSNKLMTNKGFPHELVARVSLNTDRFTKIFLVLIAFLGLMPEVHRILFVHKQFERLLKCRQIDYSIKSLECLFFDILNVGNKILLWSLSRSNPL